MSVVHPSVLLPEGKWPTTFLFWVQIHCSLQYVTSTTNYFVERSFDHLTGLTMLSLLPTFYMLISDISHEEKIVIYSSIHYMFVLLFTTLKLFSQAVTTSVITKYKILVRASMGLLGFQMLVDHYLAITDYYA